MLRIIAGYGDIGAIEKCAYGAKKKRIEGQFAKFVDPKYVPDRFKIDKEIKEYSYLRFRLR